MNGWMGHVLSNLLSAPNPAFWALLYKSGALCSHISAREVPEGDRGWVGKEPAPSCILTDPWECYPVIAYHPGSGDWFQCSALCCPFPILAEAHLCGSLSSCGVSSTSEAVTPSSQETFFKVVGSNSSNLCPLLPWGGSCFLTASFLLFCFSSNCLTNSLY